MDDVLSAVLVLMSPPEGVVKDKSWMAATKMMMSIDHFLEQLKGFRDKIDDGVVATPACERDASCSLWV